MGYNGPIKELEVYKLKKSDLQYPMTKEQRQRQIDVMMEILNNPNSSLRAKGIAQKNLLLMNSQSIQCSEDVGASDKPLEIKIVDGRK